MSTGGVPTRERMLPVRCVLIVKALSFGSGSSVS
jgi:hypothetical protein